MSNRADTDWERQPADPDSREDLEYELIDWTAVSASQRGRDYVMFIPEEEEMIRDDEFIVVEESTVLDLIEQV
jgi:hypothetical protein